LTEYADPIERAPTLEPAKSNTSPVRQGISPDTTVTPRTVALDGLRGIAVLLVIIVHSDIYFGGPFASGPIAGPLAATFGAGWIGVNLFFVLSGFLITGILYDTRDATKFFSAFFMRRSLRILPLYLGFVGIITLFAFLKSKSAGAEPLLLQDKLSLLGFYYNFRVAFITHAELPNIHHFWSLCVEEHFYLVWPFAVFLLSRLRLMRLCLMGLLAALVLRTVVVESGYWQQIAYLATPCDLDGLLAGSFVALAIREEKSRGHLFRYSKPVMVVCIILLLGLLLYQHHFYNFSGPGVDGGLDLTVGITDISILFAAIVTFTLKSSPNSQVRRWLEQTWLTRVGRYSYAMYVFHFSILAILVRLMLRLYPAAERLPDYETKPVLAIVGALISLAVAWISYELFEKHFLRLKDRFRPGEERRAAPHSDWSDRTRYVRRFLLGIGAQPMLARIGLVGRRDGSVR
jgi:peptidoglycan/LPS O-acetylase OafA/YrhL